VNDPDLLLARLRVVQELTFQAAPADEQLKFLTLNNWDAMELLKAYLNDSYPMLPALDSEGLLSPLVLQHASALGDALVALDAQLAEEYNRTGRIGALSTNGIREDPRWAPIRRLARQTLNAFADLGVPVPPLLAPRHIGRPTDDAKANSRQSETVDGVPPT
jgi:hypothetical protein